MSGRGSTDLGRAMGRSDRIVSTTESLCPMCKRVRKLSGEKRCAVHVKAASLGAHHAEFDGKIIAGSSPPGVFVGRFGYPKVFVGPMVPPISTPLAFNAVVPICVDPAPLRFEKM